VPSDTEIARTARLEPVSRIAERLGVPAGAVIAYGPYKAKLDPKFAASLADAPRGRLVLVTAMTPTQTGEGKTTVAIGLGDGLAASGRKAVVCLREPSLGPCFGHKGGATGSGRAQIAPREDINLHFTGDMHAVGAANNLLASVIDDHIYRARAPALEPARVTWRRAIDISDRALREIEIGLGGPANGVPRRDGFDIVPASEVMAVLCLAADRVDLERRLARMIVGYGADGTPVTTADLGAHRAMAALLKDAVGVNLVQSLENNPVLVHGGPFANIAHGCSSVLATRTALALTDYTVTEAGFGADLGAEKFFDIKCRQAGLTPAAAVVVATVASLKAHGGIARKALARPDVAAVLRGLPNLLHHLHIVDSYGVPRLVAINRHATDTAEELAAISRALAETGVEVVVSEHWARGGPGALELAERVAEIADGNGRDFKLLYPDALPLAAKVERIAVAVYGADGIDMEPSVRQQFDALEAAGFGNLPICMAKTPQSLSADPHLRGVPRGFRIPVRELRLAAGAGFVVALTGRISTMPGLPAVNAVGEIHLDANGEIEGLR